MTANYTKVRTHAKSIEIINEFFKKVEADPPDVGAGLMQDQKMLYPGLFILGVFVSFFFSAGYAFGCIRM